MSHQDRLSEVTAQEAIAVAHCYFNEIEQLLNGCEYLHVDYSYAD